MPTIGIRFLDSFDHYTTASQVWEAGGLTIRTSGARTGANCLDANSASTLRKNIPGVNPGTNDALNKVWVGFAFALAGAYPASSDVSLIEFLDNANVQCDLHLSTSGNLYFTRGGTQIGAASSFTVPASGYSYIEIAVVIGSGTSGSVEVRLNTTSVLTVSGVNTQSTSNNTVNQIRLRGIQIANAVYDDFYIADDKYHGELRIQTRYANAVGTFAEWTKGGGTINAQNYLQVNEHPADDDTTYVSAGNVSERDTYNFTDESFTGSIEAVMVSVRAEKDDATAQQFEFMNISGGTTSLSSPASPALSSYQYFTFMYNLDPNTALLWTQAGYNSAEFGYLHNFPQVGDNMNNWSEGTPNVTLGATIQINIH